MSEIRQLFKLLLGHEFYEKHKGTIPHNSFDEIGRELLETVKIGHERYNRNLTEEEIKALHFAENSTLTTANKNTIEVYLENIKEEEEIGPDVAETVLQAMYRKEVGRYISQYGIRLGDGDLSGICDLQGYLSGLTTNFEPTETISDAVDTDPIVLFENLKQKGKWNVNIPSLGNKIGKLSEGNFIVILARPEAGKSACVIHLMAANDGFAAQGAKVLYIGNEESAEVTAGRSICCFNEKSFREVQAAPETVRTARWEEVRHRLIFMHRPEITLSQLDATIKKIKPDVVVVDQLDHLIVGETFARSDERLGAIYRRARELASKYKCIIIGVSQASAEAEGKSTVSFSHAEGSKTSKAATADLIIGIGKVNEEVGEEGDTVLRYFTVSKNKISGWHGKITAKLCQSQSRLVA